MDKRIPEAAYTNPEVRFERVDIETRGVAYFAIALAASTLLVILAMLWYGQVLLTQYRKPDQYRLPQASVDEERLPPQPRLEALEDVKEGTFQYQPPRAEEYLKSQENLLAGGDKAKGILPIDESLADLTRLLPLSKEAKKGTQAPTNFTIELPSRASSGNTTTGGQ